MFCPHGTRCFLPSDLFGVPSTTPRQTMPSGMRSHVRIAAGSLREGARSELASAAVGPAAGPQAPPTRISRAHLRRLPDVRRPLHFDRVARAESKLGRHEVTEQPASKRLGILSRLANNQFSGQMTRSLPPSMGTCAPVVRANRGPHISTTSSATSRLVISTPSTLFFLYASTLSPYCAARAARTSSVQIAGVEDRVGMHDVDADAVSAPLQRRDPRQLRQRRLGRRVRRRARTGRRHVLGADDHHPPAARRAFNNGCAALSNARLASRLTSMTLRHSSSASASMRRLAPKMPAFNTSMSSPPKARTAASTAFPGPPPGRRRRPPRGSRRAPACPRPPG